MTLIALVIFVLLTSSFVGRIANHTSSLGSKESMVAQPLDDTPPSIQILTPMAEQVFTNLTVQVTWQADDLGSGVNLTFLRFDSGNWLNASGQSGFDAQLLLGGKHNVTVYVFDRAGNYAYDLVNFTIQVAPDAPGSMNATAGASGIVISWVTPFDGGSPILSYKVFRSLVPGNFGPVPQATASMGRYLDTDVTAGTKYYYVVRASNAQGDGPASPEVNATLADGPRPPDAPTALNATAGLGFVSLSWSSPANQGESMVVAYKVYRTNVPGANPTAPLVTLTNGQRYYIDAGLVSGAYYYKVSAINFAEGPRSNESGATVNGIEPGSPGTIVSMSLIEKASAIRLSWQSPPEGASPIFRYLIYRSLTPFDPVLLNSTNSTTFEDKTVFSGQTFHYWIVAENEQGQGPLSAMMSGAVAGPDNGIGGSIILVALVATLLFGGALFVWMRLRR
jgi:fibronectin type 3 domain-containing protein